MRRFEIEWCLCWAWILGQRMTPSAIVILERLEVMPDYTDMLRGVGPRMSTW